MRLTASPNIIYAQLKFMRANGALDESVRYLRSFTSSLTHKLQTETAAVAGRPGVSKQKLDKMSRLLARCYFKQAQWQHYRKKSVWTEVRLS